LLSSKRFVRLLCTVMFLMLVLGTMNVFAKKKITLRFFSHFFYEEPARTVITKGIKDFEKKNPNIHIEIEGTPNAQVQQKLLTYAATGTLPDVFELAFTGIEPLASQGKLLSLSRQIKRDKLGKEYANFDGETGLDGKVYGLPFYGGTDALFYNPKLFKEVGLDPDDPPRTWDELLQYAIKLTKPEKGQYGFGIYGKAAHSIRIIHYMSNAGPKGDILRPSTKKKGTWDILINSPDSVKAFKYLRSLIDHKVAPPNTVELLYPDLVSLFAQGKIAMLTIGPWGIATIRAANPNLKFKIGFHPTPDGSVPKLRDCPFAHGISKNTKHPKEAYKFLKYLSLKVGTEMCVNGFGPLSKTATNDPRVANNPYLKVFIEQEKKAYFSPQESLLPEWLKCKDQAWGPAWESIVIGNLSPEAAANQAAKKIKEILGSKGNLIYPVR
jgi:multiple sugar transport system substrate-binding protein